METESVRSGRSERSHMSGRPPHHRHHHRRSDHGNNDPDRRRTRSSHRSDRSDRDTDRETDRDDRSSRHRSHRRDGNSSIAVSINGGDGRGPFALMSSSAQRQDDNWGDTTTVITGATSDVGYSMTDIRMPGTGKVNTNIGFHCARYIGAVLTGAVGIVAFLSPIAMIILPKVGIRDWRLRDCSPACEGLLVGVAFKLLILAIGSWALFLRRPKATMPRVFAFRAVVVFLTFVLTFAYWLFYGVRILMKPDNSGKSEVDEEAVGFKSVVSFATSLVDALLFVHYLAVILIEVRQLQVQYVVKVTRSPDGETRSYTVGQFSIQRLAVWCLEKYHKDFQVYNPYLENLPRRSSRTTEFKIYDVDGGPDGDVGAAGMRGVITSSGRRESGHNDKFYEEQEYERRVTRRRARVTAAAEEAFCHIKRLQHEGGGECPMTAEEAAQAIFPTLARPLQKFLRVTRQQPRYTMDTVLEHLALCITHDMSYKSFLARYLSPGPVIWNDKDYESSETWTLVSDKLLSRDADDGTLFELRHGDIVLLVAVRKLPHFNLVEDALDNKRNKFVLRLNSETSV